MRRSAGGAVVAMSYEQFDAAQTVRRSAGGAAVAMSYEQSDAAQTVLRSNCCPERHGHGFQRVSVTMPVVPTNPSVLWHSTLPAVRAVRLESRTGVVPEAAASLSGTIDR